MLNPNRIPLLAALLSPAVVHAGTINWGSAFKDTLFNAYANPLTADFRWEMGSFAPGFTPSENNLASWEANWRLLEEGAYSQPNQYATETSVLIDNPDTGTGGFLWQRDDFDPALPASNPNVFRTGDRMYIWVYNAKGISPSTEWALVTGITGGSSGSTNWSLPADIGSQSNPNAMDWRLSTANTVVFGGLNTVDGPGFNNQVAGPYSLQTARLVPEPTTACMGLGGIAALFLRRQRRARS